MRIVIAVVSLGIVWLLVGAVPTCNLRETLTKAAEETDLQLQRILIKFFLIIKNSLVDNKVADQMTIDEYHHSFIRQFPDEKVNLIATGIDYNKTYEEINKLPQKVNRSEYERRMDSYTNDIYSKYLIHIDELEYDEVATFATRASDLIRVARHAGFTDESLDQAYDKFVRASRKSSTYYFQKFVTYLKGN